MAMIEQKDSFNVFAKVLFAVLGFIVGFIAIRLFLIPVKIDNALMEPTLAVNDYVWFYKTKKVDSGSIVLYKSPLSGKLVGRIIARSGETVEIINKQLYINGVKAAPQWAIKKSDTRIFPSRFVNRDNMNTITVPDGHVFILNDNWDTPNDSRLFGVIAIENIVGKYLFKISLKK
ncbi:MAG: signal peptidase I [Spirochaetota bacterium]